LKRWGALVVEVPDRLDHELAADLGDGSLGVEVVPVGFGRSLLRIYLPTPDEASVARTRAICVLRAWRLEPEACRLHVEAIDDEPWVERYEAALRPFPLGERFIVVPGTGWSGEGPRRPILLQPGRAFGTGEHPTTRLCAAALERHVRAGSSWLDLGTGTGILAIVAAFCGASRVAACDHDPEAVGVARELFGTNGAPSIDLRLGSADAWDGAGFDGVVANLASSYFLRSAREVAAALGQTGLVLASGFLVEDLPEVTAALEDAGFSCIEHAQAAPWSLIGARLGARGLEETA